MALNQAQLVNPPASGRTGGVKAGTGISIAADGTISTAQPPIPAGAVMIFVAATAPTGWTQVTTAAYNDASIRLVTGAGGGTGGSQNFSSAFASYTPGGSVSSSGSCTPQGSISLAGLSVSGSTTAATLSEAQLASHSHAINGVDFQFAGVTLAFANNGNPRSTSSGAAGGNGGHAHGISASVTGSATFTGSNTPVSVSSSFSGSATNQFAVKYVDMIICSKN